MACAVNICQHFQGGGEFLESRVWQIFFTFISQTDLSNDIKNGT